MNTTAEQEQQTQMKLLDMHVFDPHYGGPMMNRRYLDRFAGPVGQELVSAVRIDAANHEDLRTATDANIFQTLKDIYNLPPETNPKDFYKAQIDTANRTIRSVIDSLFPMHRATVGQRVETEWQSTYPSRVIRKLAMSDTVPRLSFELNRLLALAMTAGYIDARIKNHDLDDGLARLQESIGENLYFPAGGYTKPVPILAQHDNNTNGIVYMEGIDVASKRTDINTHWKAHHLEMRPVPGIGLVYTDGNIKPKESAVIKALRKAINHQENGRKGERRIINPTKDVNDLVRLMFVLKPEEGMTAEETDEKLDELQARVLEVVKSTIEPAAEFEPDNKDGGEGAQSPHIHFKRSQLILPDFPVPIEMIFYDLEKYLSGQFEVGQFDSKEGKYSGRAHDLYETARMIKVSQHLFPQEIYYPTPDHDNLEEAAYRTLHEKAEKLRMEGRVNR